MNKNFLAVSGLVLALLGALASCGSRENTVVVGSKNFNEQLIVGNMVASLIEKNTDLKVVRKLNLGGTNVAFEALKAGHIDMYIEYTGTGLVDIMKRPSLNDPQKVYDIVKDYYGKTYRIAWLKPWGFNNTFTLAVRQDTAKKYDLETFSDLAKVSKDLVLGATLEFCERPDGYPGVKPTYGMEFKDSKSMDGALRYNALISGKADVIDAFSTDGLIQAFDLKVLKDDKSFFPPYHAAPIVNQSVLSKYPQIEGILDRLAAAISDDEMQKMNYQVDKLQADPRQVAEDFLKSKGLL